jgi:hypothetical protein
VLPPPEDEPLEDPPPDEEPPDEEPLEDGIPEEELLDEPPPDDDPPDEAPPEAEPLPEDEPLEALPPSPPAADGGLAAHATPARVKKSPRLLPRWISLPIESSGPRRSQCPGRGAGRPRLRENARTCI